MPTFIARIDLLVKPLADRLRDVLSSRFPQLVVVDQQGKEGILGLLQAAVLGLLLDL